MNAPIPPTPAFDGQTGSGSASNAPVLRVEDLHKHFTLHLRDGRTLPVLQGVHLHVEAGECVALLGASGQGKSTLMKCLYGSYGVHRGRIQFDSRRLGNIDLAAAGAQDLLLLRRTELSYVSQFLRAVPRVSALDVVAERWLSAANLDSGDHPDDETAWALARETARACAAELLSRLNLPAALWELPPATFSGGEQQRVNIARGFIVPSRLLLLDEPTASLDATNRRVVVQLIHEARQAGSAVIGIFHDEEVRDAVASRGIDLGAPSAQPPIRHA